VETILPEKAAVIQGLFSFGVFFSSVAVYFLEKENNRLPLFIPLLYSAAVYEYGSLAMTNGAIFNPLPISLRISSEKVSHQPTQTRD
jgi:hypothetical protein